MLVEVQMELSAAFKRGREVKEEASRLRSQLWGDHDRERMEGEKAAQVL